MSASIDPMAANLSEIKAKLRAQLDLIERAEKARADADRLEAELLQEIGTASGEIQAGAIARRRRILPNPLLTLTADAPPTTQAGWIIKILTDTPNLLRQELFNKLQPTGKAPASIGQLSAILSRLKGEQRLNHDSDYRWFVRRGQ
jgi:hypothetical protein